MVLPVFVEVVVVFLSIFNAAGSTAVTARCTALLLLLLHLNHTHWYMREIPVLVSAGLTVTLFSVGYLHLG